MIRAGYSLVELMVSILLAGLVFTFSLNYYRFSNLQFIKAFKLSDFEMTQASVMRTIQRDMDEGTFYFESDSLSINLSTGQKNRKYSTKEKLLWRNEKPMYPVDFHIETINLTLSLLNCKTKEVTSQSVMKLQGYLNGLIPAQQSQLYIIDYIFDIEIEDSNLSKIVSPSHPISALTPLKLIDRVYFN